MTWVGDIACACYIRTYIRLIRKQEEDLRLKEVDNIKSYRKEIWCENAVWSTGFQLEAIVGIW
jgi:hypothetical protein